MKTINSSKNNVINANNGHFRSEGYYFLYGKEGNFDIMNGSSVSQYVNRKFTTEACSTKATFDSKLIEEMAAHGIGIGIGINSLCKPTPNMRSLIAPILTT